MRLTNYNIFTGGLSGLSPGKLLITTINAHSYNTARIDLEFQNALMSSNILIPDGISIVLAVRWLTGKRISKIAGADLFYFEMERLQSIGGKAFFLGSSDSTLSKIEGKAKLDYPNVVLKTFSPPYKSRFSKVENEFMVKEINSFGPDVLFVGIGAPKQEKWAFQHFENLDVGHVCCIGAVFDFYAETVPRAPKWMISYGLEWLYRLIREPRRMWRRYVLGNFIFVLDVFKQKAFHGGR